MPRITGSKQIISILSCICHCLTKRINSRRGPYRCCCRSCCCRLFSRPRKENGNRSTLSLAVRSDDDVVRDSFNWEKDPRRIARNILSLSFHRSVLLVLWCCLIFFLSLRFLGMNNDEERENRSTAIFTRIFSFDMSARHSHTSSDVCVSFLHSANHGNQPSSINSLGFLCRWQTEISFV